MYLVSRNYYFKDDQYIDEFQRFLDNVNYTERNPLNTEMLFLWSMIRSIQPKLFIESGTFRGYSANFICEALSLNHNNPDFISIGFDIDNCLSYASNRLSKYRFAKVIEADSRSYIKQMKHENRLVAFFIDGPKGRNMPPLFSNILIKFRNIAFIAVHDCEEDSSSGNRGYVTTYFRNQFHYLFCDSQFQEKFQYLDQNLIDLPEMNFWQPYRLQGKPRKSYGTQTCYIIPREDIAKLTQIYLSIFRFVRFSVYPQIKQTAKVLLRYEDH